MAEEKPRRDITPKAPTREQRLKETVRGVLSGCVLTAADVHDILDVLDEVEKYRTEAAKTAKKKAE
jgi:hypothetical protein